MQTRNTSNDTRDEILRVYPLSYNAIKNKYKSRNIILKKENKSLERDLGHQGAQQLMSIWELVDGSLRCLEISF